MIRAFAALLEIRRTSRVALLAGLLFALAFGEGAAIYLLLAALVLFTSVAGENAGPLERLALDAGLPAVLAVFLAVAALTAAMQYLTRREIATIRLDFLHKQRMDLFGAIRRARWLFLADRPASSVRYGFNELTEAVSYSLDQAMQALVSGALLLTGFAVAIFIDARITLILAVAGLLAAVPFRLAERQARVSSAKAAARLADLYRRLDQSLADVKFLKFLGASDSAANHIERDSLDQIGAMGELFAGSTATGALYTFASSVVMALALFVAWTIGTDPQTLLMFAIIAGRLFPRVTAMVGISRQLAELDARWIEFDTFMSELSKAAESRGSVDPPLSPVSRVSVDRVGFAYPGSRTEVLRDISFELHRGKAVGLVGLTGAGKTTTVDLLCGLFSPKVGEVRLDHRVLEPGLAEHWRERIALVDQDSAILSASLRENLVLRRPSAQDAQLNDICHTVGLGPLLARLPDGLDTFLGDGGRLLSRGERQRVSLARALLQSPDLLVLDEATASLNPLDEAGIIGVIERRKSEFATLSVAHRVSALLWVDEVLVLSNGLIVERGAPKTLLSRPESFLHQMATKTLAATPGQA